MTAACASITVYVCPMMSMSMESGGLSSKVWIEEKLLG